MKELAEKLRKFAGERDWEQFHSPKNLSNQQIGELLGLSYSSVSRRVAMVRKSIQRDEILLNKIQQSSDLIKV